MERTKFLKPIILFCALVLVSVGSSVLYHKFSKQAEATENVLTPSDKLAPDFTLTNAKGESITLSKQKGKVVVLNFWATWCKYCVAEMPELNELSKELAKNGDSLYCVNVTDGNRETKEKAEQFLKDKGYDLNVLFDTNLEASNAYNVQSLPTTLIIDKNGKICMTFYGATTQKSVMEYVNEAKKR